MCDCEIKFQVTEKDRRELREAKAHLCSLLDERHTRRESIVACMAQDDSEGAQGHAAEILKLERALLIARAKVAEKRLPGLLARRGIYASLLEMTSTDLADTRRELATLAA